MKKLTLPIHIGLMAILFCAGTSISFGQKTLAASGGNAQGSGGTVSYSVGQTDYVFQSGANGSINQGVQQPFEFYTVGVDNHPNIELSCKVFPNPTVYSVTLQVEEFSFDELYFMLFDMNGKLLKQENVYEKDTQIFMDHLQPGNYLLNVVQHQNKIKTFKIIKN